MNKVAYAHLVKFDIHSDKPTHLGPISELLKTYSFALKFFCYMYMYM